MTPTAHQSLPTILGVNPAPALVGVPNAVQTYMPPIGLNITYDSEAGSGSTSVGGNYVYIRLDQFGRPLPFTPNLPVSPDLLYSGAAPGNSLVQ